MVDAPHRHKQEGQRYQVRIYLTVPGGEIGINHQPSLHALQRQTGRETERKSAEIEAEQRHLNVAIRTAFDKARRRLQDYGRRQSGAVKHHEEMPEGRVVEIDAEGGFGYIETLEGERVYFHRNSVLGQPFERLVPGDKVSFVEEMGDKGPQASSVHVFMSSGRAVEAARTGSDARG